MINIGFATRLAIRFSPDEATGGQQAKQLMKYQGWQRVSIARSISQDVLPAIALFSLRDSASSSARF
jgi:hypothetical protein